MGGLLAISFLAQAEPTGTAFTYQGELAQQNVPATGTYDFQFDLYNVTTDGDSLTNPVQLEDVGVRDGVFSVELDFGSEVFDGTQLWLEIAVREGSSVEAYATLNPRQKLTASPYATFAQVSNGTNCTAITSLPYIISKEGVYCFTGNLSTSATSGNAISISTDNVVIDLNGWTLDGLSAGDSTETVGIYADQQMNITIRNGTIRGFHEGVKLADVDPNTSSQAHLVEDLRAENNTSVGLRVMGSGNIVRRNQIVETGGTTIPVAVVGLAMHGPGGRALNNDIINTVGTVILRTYGLFFGNADGGVAEGNRIDHVSTNEGKVSHGIGIHTSDDVLVVNNRITNSDEGIRFLSFLSGSTGKYRDNLTSNVITPYSGGTNSGGND